MTDPPQRPILHPGSTIKTMQCALCGVQWEYAEVPVHIPKDHTDADWEAYRVANGLTDPYPRFLVVDPPPSKETPGQRALRRGIKL